MTNIWFTSDTHFGHANIVGLANRPFRCVEEMDEFLIAKWNALVRDEDVVYHLGDFSYKSSHHLGHYFARLNGSIRLILGNHDKLPQILSAINNPENSIESVEQYKDLEIRGQRLILFHYPIHSWNGRWKNVWHLHGHSHGQTPFKEDMYRLDVGVDVHDYAPISFERVADIMAKVKVNQSES